MTFNEFCQNCTPEERRDLVYFLAAFRMRKTVELLLPQQSQ